MGWFTNWLERRGSFRMITRKTQTGETEDYLKRYFIVHSKWFGIYLHQVFADDDGPLHDHPWTNLSVVLKGGYKEICEDGITRIRKPGSLVARKATTLHKLELNNQPGEVWSLFFFGRRKRKWGFLMPNGGWIEASAYGELIGSPIEGESYLKFKGWFLPVFLGTFSKPCSTSP